MGWFIVYPNYNPVLDWYYAPLVWLSGLACLWVTRYTHRYYPRWGRKYYALSAIVRPLGIILISWGWVEVVSQRELPKFINEYYGTALFSYILLIFILCIVSFFRNISLFILVLILIFFSAFTQDVFFPTNPSMLLLFYCAFLFGIYSIFKLGIRKSIFYRKINDTLVTTGPYRISRHPQLLSAIIMVNASCFFFGDRNPGNAFFLTNAIILSFIIWLIIMFEEKDLVSAFGQDYIIYKNIVPRIFPDIVNRGCLTLCKSCNKDFIGKINYCGICGQKERLTYIEPSPLLKYLLFILPLALFLTVISFIKFSGWIVEVEHGVSKQSEARHNLREIYTAQMSFYTNNRHFAFKGAEGYENLNVFQQINWEPLGRTRYNYCFGKESFIPALSPASAPGNRIYSREFIDSICDKYSGSSPQGFTAAAIGNIDSDEALDIWTMNNARELKCIINDVDVDELPELHEE